MTENHNSSGRTIVIGDVQGCLLELIDLTNKVDYTPERDRLILAGDLLDRGPDSAAVVRWAMERRAEAVMGNHEESHLRWRMHEERATREPSYHNPMRTLSPAKREVQESIGTAGWSWLAGLPLFLHINDTWSVVHAGCTPGKPVEEQDKRHLTRLRYVRRADGKMAKLGDPMTGETHAYWTELWDGSRSIVYGHHVEKRGPVHTWRWNGKLEQVICNPDGHIHDGLDLAGATLGIDTGCCFGGSLTAAIFCRDGHVRFASVQARDKYAEQMTDEEAADA